MGGGVIRSAGKAASIGAYCSPLIDKTARRAAPHRVSALPSAEPALESRLSASFSSSDKDLTEVSAVAHWPTWETDDWELAGGREEENFGSANPAPRMVFGPAPSIEEAKEAASDLKEVLEKVYFQPNHFLKTHEGCQMSVSGESSTVSTMPKHVAQMFSLLQPGTEAQAVVTSLAADKSVWEAVMKNEKVMEFCKTTSPTLESVCTVESVPVNEFLEESSPTVESEETSKGSMLADIVNTFKVKVSEMVSNISDFLQDFLGILPGNSKATDSTAESLADLGLGAAFVGLAVATIMVVVFKRG